MAIRFISYGKKLNNLKISVESALIGSEYSTFKDKISRGDTLLLMCESKVWGHAIVDSDISFETHLVWQDKRYPYRAKLKDIQIYVKPFTLEDYQINESFRDEYGKGWAFKVLFTPGDIPTSIETRILEIITAIECLDKNDHIPYLEKHAVENVAKRRIRLGL